MSYVWALLFIWCVFMRLPDWSNFNLSDPDWLGFIATVIVALVAAAGYKPALWLWKYTIIKYGNFKLRFIDHPPPDHTVHNVWFPYQLPIGTFKVCCFVQAVSSFAIAKLNFRFQNEEGTNASKSIIEILGIEECECDPRTLESVRSDTQGGMDGWCKSNMPSLAADESRCFWITARASSSWTGYLSFRAQDITGFRSYGRHKVVISEASGSPLLLRDTSLASGFISMRDAAVQLYSEVREKKHVLARLAERSGGRALTSNSHEVILDDMATYFAIAMNKPVYGKRVPSNRQEHISSADVRASRFTGGATKLANLYNQSVYFTDLVVKVDDLNELLAQLQLHDGFYGEMGTGETVVKEREISTSISPPDILYDDNNTSYRNPNAERRSARVCLMRILIVNTDTIKPINNLSVQLMSDEPALDKQHLEFDQHSTESAITLNAGGREYVNIAFSKHTMNLPSELWVCAQRNEIKVATDRDCQIKVLLTGNGIGRVTKNYLLGFDAETRMLLHMKELT